MARMKKDEVIAALKELGAKFDPKAAYNDLCKMLKGLKPKSEKETSDKSDEVKVIKVKNVMRKRNSYVNPSYRLERDEAELAKITSRRDLKGKIEKVVVVRHMEANKDGDLVTEMEVHLK